MNSVKDPKKSPEILRVIEKMTELGYRKIAGVHIEGSEELYTPMCKESSATSLFFDLPDKAIIVQATLNRVVELRGYSGEKKFWTGAIYAASSPDRFYLAWLGKHKFDLEAVRTATDISDFTPEELRYRRFCEYGIGKNGDWWPTILLSEDTFNCFAKETKNDNPAFLLGEIAETFRPILSKYFQVLDVTCFPPLSLFPRCQGIFWPKFPIGKLNAKTKERIWGFLYPKQSFTISLIDEIGRQKTELMTGADIIICEHRDLITKRRKHDTPNAWCDIVVRYQHVADHLAKKYGWRQVGPFQGFPHLYASLTGEEAKFLIEVELHQWTVPPIP